MRARNAAAALTALAAGLAAWAYVASREVPGANDAEQALEQRRLREEKAKDSDGPVNERENLDKTAEGLKQDLATQPSVR